MSSVSVPHSADDTVMIVKIAFEEMDDINEYRETSDGVVGKTGIRLGLFTSSYGENIHVEIIEDNGSPEQSTVYIRGERAVGVNITSDPEKYANIFEMNLRELKDHDIGRILDTASDMGISGSKEVSNVPPPHFAAERLLGGVDLADNADIIAISIVILMLILFLTVVI